MAVLAHCCREVLDASGFELNKSECVQQPPVLPSGSPSCDLQVQLKYDGRSLVHWYLWWEEDFPKL